MERPPPKRCTRSSSRNENITFIDLPVRQRTSSRRRQCRDGRLWLDDIGMIVAQHIHSIPCLRILFCVNKAFCIFCRQRFISINREMETSICDDVQYMIKNDTTSMYGTESTFVWHLLQVVLMREKVLRVNRRVRLDVNSLFEAARTSRAEFQQKVDASNQRLQALRDELLTKRKSTHRNPQTVELLRDATIVADKFKDDAAQLSQENARALRAMGTRLRALLRKSNQCLRRNLREIDKVTRKCWALAAELGSPAWAAGLRAASRRIDAALDGRLRLGARARSRFDIVREDGRCRVAVSFVPDLQDG